MKDTILKALLSFGVSAIAKLIPALSGLLGGPLGFVVGIAINWLTGKLYDWLEQLARYRAIDAQIKSDVAGVKAAATDLKKVQDDTTSSEDQRAKALVDFTNAARTLGKFRLQ